MLLQEKATTIAMQCSPEAPTELFVGALLTSSGFISTILLFTDQSHCTMRAAGLALQRCVGEKSLWNPIDGSNGIRVECFDQKVRIPEKYDLIDDCCPVPYFISGPPIGAEVKFEHSH